MQEICILFNLIYIIFIPAPQVFDIDRCTALQHLYQMTIYYQRKLLNFEISILMDKYFNNAATLSQQKVRVGYLSFIKQQSITAAVLKQQFSAHKGIKFNLLSCSHLDEKLEKIENGGHEPCDHVTYHLRISTKRKIKNSHIQSQLLRSVRRVFYADWKQQATFSIDKNLKKIFTVHWSLTLETKLHWGNKLTFYWSEIPFNRNKR